MCHDKGESAESFDAEIPVRDPIQTVEADGIESEFLSFEGPVGVVCGSCEGAASDGADVDSLPAVRNPLDVPEKHH